MTTANRFHYKIDDGKFKSRLIKTQEGLNEKRCDKKLPTKGFLTILLTHTAATSERKLH